MKNLSSEPPATIPRAQVKAFVYRDWNLSPGEVATADVSADEPESPPPPADGLARELEEEIRRQTWNAARDQLWPEAQRQAEQALEARFTQQLEAERAAVLAAIDAFTRTRRRYFQKLERDVVQLVLAIARRVLQREAQLDPLLLAGTVRVAIEPLASGSGVTLVVAPSQRELWESRVSAERQLATRVRIASDPALEPCGCRLETENGATDLGWETQLREVEQSFFELLRRREDSDAPVADETEASVEELQA